MNATVQATLETALLRELAERYQWENRARFGNRLVAPVLVLSDTTARLGRWIASTRTLELSRELVFARPWVEVISVLEHEMAHQFVSEVLHAREDSAHGQTFRRVCAERGIDARAGGGPTQVADAESDRQLEGSASCSRSPGSAKPARADSR